MISYVSNHYTKGPVFPSDHVLYMKSLFLTFGNVILSYTSMGQSSAVWGVKHMPKCFKTY